MIFFSIIIIFLNSYESSINLFRLYPFSDLTSVGGISSISFIDRKTGIYSPSFLAALNGSSFSGSFWRDYSGNGYFSFFSFSYDIDFKSGLNLAYYGYNSGLDDLYTLNGSFENLVFEKSYILSTSYGLSLNDKLFLGFKGKYLSSTLLEQYRDSTYTFDGELFLNLFPYYLKLGVENIGGKIKYINETEKLPSFLTTEIAKSFSFKDLYLSSGFAFKRSRDYSIYSAGSEILFRKIPFKFSCGYQKDELKRFFIGLGLFFENIYISSSFSFPKVFQSNDLRFSFTYFFKSQELKFNNETQKNKTIKKTYPQKKDLKQEEKIKKKNSDIIVF